MPNPQLRSGAVPSLSLFGAPELRFAGVNRVKLGSRARYLLAYLAIDGLPKSRVHLAQLLWPDRPTTQGRASLRQCVVELQRAFASFDIRSPLRVDHNAISIVRSELIIDFDNVLRAAVDRDAGSLAQALAATGACVLLDSATVEGEFARWVTALRTRLRVEVEAALSEIFAAARLEPSGTSTHRKALLLARIRLEQVPDCRLALAMIEPAIAASPGMMRRTPLPPLPLPTDAPPVVLIEPFRCDDPAGGIIADALREEIISALACFRELRVVVLTDRLGRANVPDGGGYRLSMLLRGRPGTQSVVGRLTANIDGLTVWGGRVPLGGGDVQGAIDDLVERIIGAIAPAVEVMQLRLARDHPSGAIYSRYLVAAQAAQAPGDFEAALATAEEFEQIVGQAAQFAPAQLALARLYNTDFAWTRAMSSTDSHRDRALSLARTAAAAEPSNVHCATVLGWCHLRRHEWGAARRFFDQGLRLNPYHATRLMEAAYGILHLGDLDTAETILRRCLTISPGTIDGVQLDLGMLALLRGDPMAAHDYLTTIIHPDPWALIATAIATFQAGLPYDRPRDAARCAVAKIWTNSALPSFPIVREWVITRHPFRLREHLARYSDGLAEILG